jgi:hypothetical protein
MISRSETPIAQKAEAPRRDNIETILYFWGITPSHLLFLLSQTPVPTAIPKVSPMPGPIEKKTAFGPVMMQVSMLIVPPYRHT